MSLFDQLKEKVTDAGQATIKKTKEFADVSHLNSQISEEEKKIEAFYSELGKEFRKTCTDAAPEALRNIISDIEISEAKIEEFKAEIQRIKNIKTCPKCGATIEKGARFCKECGFEMPDAESVAYCPKCRAKNRLGNKFCSACGATLEQDLSDNGVGKEEI